VTLVAGGTLTLTVRAAASVPLTRERVASLSFAPTPGMSDECTSNSRCLESTRSKLWEAESRATTTPRRFNFGIGAAAVVVVEPVMVDAAVVDPPAAGAAAAAPLEEVGPGATGGAAGGAADLTGGLEVGPLSESGSDEPAWPPVSPLELAVVLTAPGDGGPVTSATIFLAAAAALVPMATGPTATPIRIPDASIPTASAAVMRPLGSLTRPLRPAIRSARIRRALAGAGASASGAGWGVSGRRRAPQETQ
jgi:hypothetical protein